jgi:hypothetical protein
VIIEENTKDYDNKYEFDSFEKKPFWQFLCLDVNCEAEIAATVALRDLLRLYVHERRHAAHHNTTAYCAVTI